MKASEQYYETLAEQAAVRRLFQTLDFTRHWGSEEACMSACWQAGGYYVSPGGAGERERQRAWPGLNELSVMRLPLALWKREPGPVFLDPYAVYLACFEAVRGLELLPALLRLARAVEAGDRAGMREALAAHREAFEALRLGVWTMPQEERDERPGLPIRNSAETAVARITPKIRPTVGGFRLLPEVGG